MFSSGGWWVGEVEEGVGDSGMMFQIREVQSGLATGCVIWTNDIKTFDIKLWRGNNENYFQQKAVS